jgi:1,2-diacylglycerol 3-alpha-glucosyltransferase
MNILHICIATHFTEGYSYQENILPEKHIKLGYNVKIICGPLGYNERKIPSSLKSCKKILDNGILLTRLPYLMEKLLLPAKLKIVKNLYEEINNFLPDIIFVHGVQFYGLKTVLKYKKKHLSVKVYIDNHADFVNTAIKNLKHIILIIRFKVNHLFY